MSWLRPGFPPRPGKFCMLPVAPKKQKSYHLRDRVEDAGPLQRHGSAGVSEPLISGPGDRSPRSLCCPGPLQAPACPAWSRLPCSVLPALEDAEFVVTCKGSSRKPPYAGCDDKTISRDRACPQAPRPVGGATGPLPVPVVGPQEAGASAPGRLLRWGALGAWPPDGPCSAPGFVQPLVARKLRSQASLTLVRVPLARLASFFPS